MCFSKMLQRLPLLLLLLLSRVEAHFMTQLSESQLSPARGAKLHVE
jgi:hypothetical protein